jgi:hypothetical protein
MTLNDSSPTYDTVIDLVRRMSPAERVRLIALIASSLVEEKATTPIQSLRGLLSGMAPSADEIDAARREMWSNFPREDI